MQLGNTKKLDIFNGTRLPFYYSVQFYAIENEGTAGIKWQYKGALQVYSILSGKKGTIYIYTISRHAAVKQKFHWYLVFSV